MSSLNSEQVLASAVKYLIQGQDLYEASVLLLCELNISAVDDYDGVIDLALVLLSDNRAVYDLFQGEGSPSAECIFRALAAVLPIKYRIDSIKCLMHLSDYDPDWRDTLLEVIEGKRPLNQGVPIQEKPRYTWERLFFRSPVEIVIAKALDKRDVFFLPNCMGRLGATGSRENREADFLVCCEGRWGILEVNGDAYHTNSAKDHDRGRLFKLHGISVFEPYEARRCMKEPDNVIQEFLELIKRNA